MSYMFLCGCSTGYQNDLCVKRQPTIKDSGNHMETFVRNKWETIDESESSAEFRGTNEQTN